MRPSYYELLQLQVDSPDSAVVASYRWARQCVANDPDRQRRLEAIEEAYHALNDADRRLAYDGQLATGAAPTVAANGIPLTAADAPIENSWRGCTICGSFPARDYLIVRCTGIVFLFLFSWNRTNADQYCRMHGQEEARTANRHNLLLGWWGILAPIANLVAIAFNLRAHAAFGRLPPTGPAEASSSRVVE